MNVIFYQLTKKPNSTKLPSDSGTTISCDIKSDCSIMAPSLTLNLGTENAPTYNYCYISAFSRYYFINDWSYFQGLWSADLSIDVLGTYRTAIGNSSLFVLRSSYTYNNRLIDDTYPITYTSTSSQVLSKTDSGYFYCLGHSGTTSTSDGYAPWGKDFDDGSVVLGVTSQFDNGITYYIMPVATFELVFKWLINAWPDLETSWVLDLGDNIKKAFYKPLSFITTCYWIPSQGIPGVSYNQTKIHIGEMEQEFSSYLSSSLDILNDNPAWYMRFDLPDHPLASSRGYWLDNEPYTFMTLDLLPFGSIALPMSKLAGATSIMARIIMDIPTGNAELYLYTGTYGNLDTLIYHACSKYGVDLPLTQSTISTSAMGAAATVASAVRNGIGQAKAELDLEEMQGASFKGKGRGSKQHALKVQREKIEDYASAYQASANKVPTAIGSLLDSGTVSSSGSPGSAVAFSKVRPSLWCQFYGLTDDNNAMRGRPLCEIKKLSDIPGFIKTNDGDIDLSCTQAEKDAISSYLTSGFFYE